MPVDETLKETPLFRKNRCNPARCLKRAVEIDLTPVKETLTRLMNFAPLWFYAINFDISTKPQHWYCWRTRHYHAWPRVAFEAGGI